MSTLHVPERVWRWVLEQQGLAADVHAEVPELEDESARMRSCFSDASASETEREDELTMDDLVREMDGWMAGEVRQVSNLVALSD